MKTIITKGIVLSRTDYAEADRIIKFLTPDHGKISVIAKGVRKSKSKLAGSIELFSISEISYIVGRSDVYTLISARLFEYYGNIVKDIERTSIGYECIKLLNNATADEPEEAYFNLLNLVFEALDDLKLDPDITTTWFYMQLLKLAGHSPNLLTDTEGEKLKETDVYKFDIESMSFIESDSKQGTYDSRHIKMLRVGFAARSPRILNKVEDVGSIIEPIHTLVNSMLNNQIRV